MMRSNHHVCNVPSRSEGDAQARPGMTGHSVKDVQNVMVMAKKLGQTCWIATRLAFTNAVDDFACSMTSSLRTRLSFLWSRCCSTYLPKKPARRIDNMATINAALSTPIKAMNVCVNISSCSFLIGPSPFESSRAVICTRETAKPQAPLPACTICEVNADGNKPAMSYTDGSTKLSATAPMRAATYNEDKRKSGSVDTRKATKR
mmetsp:Transcript_6495/g.19262  ORF Transcript_6495/g.19262 Transcript_6495/m.19262 type:complete len:204 (-) Transcript_6495:454-1065(-)